MVVGEWGMALALLVEALAVGGSIGPGRWGCVDLRLVPPHLSFGVLRPSWDVPVVVRLARFRARRALVWERV